MISVLRKSPTILGALALMGQWGVVLAVGVHDPVLVACSSGAGIFGAAFALSWAAEVSQLDIPSSLAVVFVALLAVLPEYAVDMYFAWQAGQDPTYTQYATANMTGANRILIGLGWPMVVFAYWWKTGEREVSVAVGSGLEVYYLLLATIYAFVLPWKGTISWVDTVVLVGLFLAYVRQAAADTVIEPDLEGAAESIAELPTGSRRAFTLGLFGVAGGAIFTAAEPFAEALLEIGRESGIEEFVLVQWVAPLASETPEFVVAILFALRRKATLAFAALLSSKVNQWTLLVGMLPVAFGLSAGGWEPMQLDLRQSQEILLTCAQSLFAVVVVADLRFRLREAIALAVLFLVQLAWPDPTVREAFIWIYVGAAALVVLVRPEVRAGLRYLVRTRGAST